jgi:outer membrane protein assembly factor BamB
MLLGVRAVLAATAALTVFACGDGGTQPVAAPTTVVEVGTDGAGPDTAPTSAVEIPRLPSEQGRTIDTDPTGPAPAPGAIVEIDTDRPQLVALDAADGSLHWTRPTNLVTYGLAVSDGLLIEAGSDACGETPARIRGIDVDTGEIVWSVRYRQTGFGAHVGAGGFAVADGVVVFSDTAGLVALEASDGTERWRRASFPAFDLAAGGGVVVAAAESSFVVPAVVEAFRLVDGSPAWSATGLPPMQLFDISWVGDVVFVSGFDGDFPVFVLDGTTGAVDWTPPGPLVSGAGDLAVTGAAHATLGVSPASPSDPAAATDLVGLDSATGRERWRVPADGAATSSAGVVTWTWGTFPALPPADGSFPFVPSSLTGRDSAGGAERWMAEAILGAVVNDLALLVHEDATIDAVGVADGEHRWETAWPSTAVPPPAGFSATGGDGVVVIQAFHNMFGGPESCSTG